MFHVVTMKSPLKAPISIKITTKKATINTITKYFPTTKPTYTKYYSKTTTLIIKIKQAKKI